MRASVDAPFESAPVRRPIRVAVVVEPPGGPTDPAIATTVRRAADVLADAGYEIADVCPPRYGEAIETWARFLIGDFAPVLPQLLGMMGEDARTFLGTVRAGVAPLADAAAYSALLIQRDSIGRAWSQFSPRRRSCSHRHGLNIRSRSATTSRRRRPPAR